MTLPPMIAAQMALALSVAREHLDWAAGQGVGPSEALADAGVPAPRGLDRQSAERELARHWLRQQAAQRRARMMAAGRRARGRRAKPC